MCTVGELIKALQSYSPSSRVLIAMQPSYPFEVELQGVTVRERLDTDEDDAQPDTDPTDVFLVEGDQLRYGSSDLWDNLDYEW
jgi:hypothetical protein